MNSEMFRFDLGIKKLAKVLSRCYETLEIISHGLVFYYSDMSKFDLIRHGLVVYQSLTSLGMGLLSMTLACQRLTSLGMGLLSIKV